MNGYVVEVIEPGGPRICGARKTIREAGLLADQLRNEYPMQELQIRQAMVYRLMTTWEDGTRSVSNWVDTKERIRERIADCTKRDKEKGYRNRYDIVLGGCYDSLRIDE